MKQPRLRSSLFGIAVNFSVPKRLFECPVSGGNFSVNRIVFSLKYPLEINCEKLPAHPFYNLFNGIRLFFKREYQASYWILAVDRLWPC